jgi:hypothetical protein
MNRPSHRTLLRLATLALPLLGLGGAWAIAHSRAQQGTEWEVPVAGVDPRDLLRGHYIVYRYRWPGLPEGTAPGTTRELCLAGTPPRIEAVTPVDGSCAHPVREPGPGRGLSTGRLYIPQDKALGLERQLAEPSLQGVLRMRVRADGQITPLALEFRPRPEPVPRD